MSKNCTTNIEKKCWNNGNSQISSLSPNKSGGHKTKVFFHFENPTRIFEINQPDLSQNTHKFIYRIIFPQTRRDIKYKPRLHTTTSENIPSVCNSNFNDEKKNIHYRNHLAIPLPIVCVCFFVNGVIRMNDIWYSMRPIFFIRSNSNCNNNNNNNYNHHQYIYNFSGFFEPMFSFFSIIILLLLSYFF